jgi:hypothetical protein
MHQIEKEKSDLIIRLTKATNRVIKLHKNVNGYCTHCRFHFDGALEDDAEYPCPTIKALDGEQ